MVVDPVECVSGFPIKILGDFSCKVSLRTERLSAVTIESVWSLTFIIELIVCLFSFGIGCIKFKFICSCSISICINALISVESVEIKCIFVAVVCAD